MGCASIDRTHIAALFRNGLQPSVSLVRCRQTCKSLMMYDWTTEHDETLHSVGTDGGSG